MRPYRLLAPAKINLYLEILGLRTDNYHELVMILQSVDLADILEIRPNGTEEMRIYCHHPEVPANQSNLAYKAAVLMAKQFPSVAHQYGGLDITIEKRVPVAAGLAGGSANAAAVLVGVNLIWELGLTLPELQALAAQLGSDIPFCIAGGTAIATGRGEKLDPLEDLDNLSVVLAKYRSLAISTPWAYQTYRQMFESSYLGDSPTQIARTQAVHSGSLVQAIVAKDALKIGHLLHNDLEKAVLPNTAKVQQLKAKMSSLGGLGTLMSGSGPTVFTLCQSPAEADSLQATLISEVKDPDLEVWTAKLCSNGIQVINHE